MRGDRRAERIPAASSHPTSRASASSSTCCLKVLEAGPLREQGHKRANHGAQGGHDRGAEATGAAQSLQQRELTARRQVGDVVVALQR